MAGLAYIYQGEEISFDDPEFNDPQFGTIRLNMNVSGSKVRHGFTSDVSASQYCSLKFRINSSQTARIGRQRTRSRVSSESEHTESWSGTGYLSETRTVEEIIDDKTIWTGAYTMQSSFTSSCAASTWCGEFGTSFTYRTGAEETGTTKFYEQTSSTSQIYTESSETYNEARGYQLWYRTMLYTTTLQTATQYVYPTYTVSYRDSGLKYTKLSSVSRTETNGITQSHLTRTNMSRNITYGAFETTIEPRHTLTHTATFETLHNYNL